MLQGSVGCTAAAALRRRADARSIRRSRWKRGVVKSTGVKFAQYLQVYMVLVILTGGVAPSYGLPLSPSFCQNEER